MSSRHTWRSTYARRGATVGLAALLAMVPLGGCATSSSAEAQTAATAATTAASEQDSSAAHLLQATERVSDRDQDPSYDEASACYVTLADGASAADGSGASVDGNTVTITAGGTYVLSGTLSNGQVVVDAGDEKVQLVLDGANVSCEGSAALYVRSADKVFLTLADGSDNALCSTGEFVQADDEINVDGAVFSKDDLTVNGGGSLTVSSETGHGIVCKDDLVLVSGTVSVTAADHAIQAKDTVTVAGGTWELAAGTDGIHCGSDDDADAEGSVLVMGGTVSVTCDSDGFDATGTLEVDGGQVSVDAGDDGLHSDAALQVDGGTISISECYEGLEGATVTVNGGDIDLTSSDDGLNATGYDDDSSTSSSGDAGDVAGGDVPASGNAAAGGGAAAGGDAPSGNGMPAGGMGGGADDYVSSAQIYINGGTLRIQAGGDGIDSNGDLTVTGGETYVSGPTSDGDGSLDYAGSASVSGGIVMCAGSSGMAQNFGDASTQGTMLVSASGSAGDKISLADSDGNVLASFTAQTSYACVVVTAPGIEAGKTYTLTYGDQTTTVEMDDTVYSDVTGGMGDGPGAGAGQQPDGSGAPDGQGGPAGQGGGQRPDQASA